MENRFEALRFIQNKIQERMEQHPVAKNLSVVFQAFPSGNLPDKTNKPITEAVNDVINHYKQQNIFKPKALEEILSFLKFKVTIIQWEALQCLFIEAANHATEDLLLDNWREERLNDGN